MSQKLSTITDIYAPRSHGQNSREIRSIHDDDTIRVYQAYSDEIADSAVAANSFRAPLESEIWSKTRMTWIKPSKVWMGYRCGWTVLKDDKQARVLALDLSRDRFESLLRDVTVTDGHAATDESKHKCRNSDVVVQWDPERYLATDAGCRNVYTTSDKLVRSIQIGLRGAAVEALLDDNMVRQITDVTQDFRETLKALQNEDVRQATEAMWPEGQLERVMNVPDDLRNILQMPPIALSL